MNTDITLEDLLRRLAPQVLGALVRRGIALESNQETAGFADPPEIRLAR